MAAALRSVKDLPISGKRVLLRVDFNVPLTKDSPPRVVDDTRIQEALPTLRYCLEQKAKLIICSHLGRPKGKPEPKYSLEPVAARLAELLSKEVILSDEPVGDGVKKQVFELKEGQILLLENLRFNPGEEKNDDQ